MKWRLNVIALLLSAWITQSVLAGDGLTLDQYLAQVIESNPAVKSSQNRTTAAQFRIQPSAILDDPFLAVGIDEVPFGEHRAEIFRYQVSQTFPFPGKLGARKEIAKSSAAEARQSAETLRRELIVIATQLFYKAYYMDEAIVLNRELHRLVDTSVQSTKAKYQSGGAEHHEWLLGTIELANLDVEYARLVRDRNSLGVQLNELRGVAATTMSERIVAQFSTEPDLADASNIMDQPEIKALDAQINRAESEYRMSKLASYPDFVVQVMAMEPNGGMEEESGNWGVMVGVNVPLYYSLKQSKLASAANAEKHAAEMDRLYLLNKLKTEIFSAQQQFASAKDVAQLYEQKVMPATELALANAQSAYAAQRVDLKKYLDVLKVYKTQKLELVAARADIELARTRLRELLSSPPLMRLAPSRPSLFGGSSDMGSGMTGSAPVSMGGGMSNLNATKKNAAKSASGESAGMGGM